MSTDMRTTSIAQSNESSTDQADTQDQVKAPTFHVQTGVRAGRDFMGWFASLPPELQDEAL
jgi:hypothetical protein